MAGSLTCPKCGSATVQPAGEGYRCAQCGAALWRRPLDTGAAHCPRCKTAVMSNALYCHTCGAELYTLAVLAPCPTCGRPAPANGVFCPYCRAALTQVTDRPESTQPEVSEASRSRQSVGCPACGRTIGPDAPVCRYCGVNIDEFLRQVLAGQKSVDDMLRSYDATYGLDTDLLERPPQAPSRPVKSKAARSALDTPQVTPQALLILLALLLCGAMGVILMRLLTLRMGG